MNINTLFSSNSLWKPVVRAGGIGAINRVVSILIRLVTIPLTFNYLGNEMYGLWMTIASFSGYIQLLDFGIGSAMINRLTLFYINNEINQFKKYVYANLLFQTLLALIVFLSILVIIPLVDWNVLFKLKTNIADSELHFIMLVALFMFLLQLITMLLLKIPYTMQRGALAEIYLLIGNILSALGILFCINNNWGIVALILCITSSTIISALLILIHLSIKNKIAAVFIKFTDMKYVFKDLYRTGMDYFIIQVVGVLILTLQYSILAYYHGVASVASYGIMFQVLIAIQIPFSVLQQPLWSKFVELIAINKYHEVGVALKKYIKLAGVYSLFILVIYLLFLPIILGYVMKQPIESSFELRLGFSLWAIAGLLAGGGVGACLLAMNLTRELAYINIFQFIVFIGAAFIFVPHYSAVGMIGSIILMYIVTMPIIFTLLKKKVFL